MEWLTQNQKALLWALIDVKIAEFKKNWDKFEHLEKLSKALVYNKII